ncbi:Protein of unknown function [Klenkia taihuensis]|uniref:DUF4232 domain-containing protein n=2 Tax=Klenkia taihuensis TaxID=1225127 RepID=A0A1I1HEK5_9ACTN|nr:Protein of unknown function [Klenkia taihuensis]
MVTSAQVRAVVARGNMVVMTNSTKRLALPVLLAAGVLTSACSFSGGTEDAAAATGSGTSASSAPASTPAATTTAAAPTSSSAAAVTAAPESGDPQPTAAGDPDRCHTSELAGSLSEGDAAAGNRYATLTLTNTGGEVCTVYGYGGIGLVGPGGSVVPSTQERVPAQDGSGGRRTTLQPGDSVSAQLHWTVVATGPEPTTGQCEPTPSELTVIPPNETDSLSVAWTFGPVCSMGEIEQTPYAPA